MALRALGLALALLVSTATIAQEFKLAPVDEGASDASWPRFKARLLEALARRDQQFLLDIVDRKIRNTSGIEGQAEFKKLQFPQFFEFSLTFYARRVANFAIDDIEQKLLIAARQRFEQPRLETRPACIARTLVDRRELELLGDSGCRDEQCERQAERAQGHQHPLNLPRRFSKNAVSASWWSSVLWHSA